MTDAAQQKSKFPAFEEAEFLTRPVLDELIDWSLETKGMFAEGHHSVKAMRGACLSSGVVLWDVCDGDKAQIWKARVERVWMVERPLEGDEAWEFESEWVRVPADFKGARPITTIIFDPKWNLREVEVA